MPLSEKTQRNRNRNRESRRMKIHRQEKKGTNPNEQKRDGKKLKKI